VRRELSRQRRIVAGLDDHGDIGVVLGGGADHGGTADVDVLDAVVEARALRHGLLERVEVDDEQVDRGECRGPAWRGMLGIGADRQQAAMDLGMERLDAAVHHLRKAGQLGHVAHGEAGSRELLSGAAGRDELYAVAGEDAGELDQPGLVRHREESAGNAAQLIGHGSAFADGPVSSSLPVFGPEVGEGKSPSERQLGLGAAVGAWLRAPDAARG